MLKYCWNGPKISNISIQKTVSILGMRSFLHTVKKCRKLNRNRKKNLVFKGIRLSKDSIIHVCASVDTNCQMMPYYLAWVLPLWKVSLRSILHIKHSSIAYIPNY